MKHLKTACDIQKTFLPNACIKIAAAYSYIICMTLKIAAVSYKLWQLQSQNTTAAITAYKRTA